VLGDATIRVDRSRDLSPQLEQLYADYIDNSIDRRSMERDYALGLSVFLDAVGNSPRRAVKGHVTGPISLGLTVTDLDQRPLLYDEVLADAAAKHLRLKAAWQEKALASVSPNTIISIDEPYLTSVGSAYVSVQREQVVTLLEETLAGISGLKAIHCCGNTDWSVVLGTSLDILSFDAYNYGETLSLYPDEVARFLARGGVVAWGIVPNSEQALSAESASSLLDRLTDTMDLLANKGVDGHLIRSRCLITPSCGLDSLSLESAARALELTAAVSARYRERCRVPN
jgi:methionine synthase II (cobalamin-independent)